jgi:hypothetical protein
MAFNWDENPLKNVRVELPKEPLLMEKLDAIKRSVGISATKVDGMKIENMKDRQKREQERNKF